MNETEYLMKNYGDRGGCYPAGGGGGGGGGGGWGRGEEARSGIEKRCSHNLQSGHPA